MNKVKILFDSSWQFTTLVLNEIFHHENVNVSTHILTSVMSFSCCTTLQMILIRYSLLDASQNWRQWSANPCILPPDLKAKKSVILRPCDDQILNQKDKISKLKSRSKMTGLKCRTFSSIIVQRTPRSHLRANIWPFCY